MASEQEQSKVTFDLQNNADECQKLLDNGWEIRLFKNQLGSYTGQARHQRGRREITDDFTPSQTLYRLTEKVFGNVVMKPYGPGEYEKFRALVSAAPSLLAACEAAKHALERCTYQTLQDATIAGEAIDQLRAAVAEPKAR